MTTLNHFPAFIEITISFKHDTANFVFTNSRYQTVGDLPHFPEMILLCNNCAINVYIIVCLNYLISLSVLINQKQQRKQ